MVKFVRDSKIVWPYCSACNCRLGLTKLPNNAVIASHFGMFGSTDARGCFCKYVNMQSVVPNSLLKAFI